MFLLNLGHRWSIASAIDGLQGVIPLPARISSARLVRSSLQEFQNVLLDPQLYLAGLDAARCTRTCAHLASYPWFCVKDFPDFDSTAENRTDWQARMRGEIADKWPGAAPEGDAIEEACKACIEFQLHVPCSQVILPSPLITSREDEAQTQAEWLDAGLAAAKKLEFAQPTLGSIALHDRVLDNVAFEAGGFLDAVADHVTARDGIDGVYIVVVKAQQGHPFEADKNVFRAYAKLTHVFSRAGCDSIVTNFADVFGFVCRGLGATSFASGQSQILRQMALPSLEDDTFGYALPHLYSHRVIGELRTEDDLDEVAKSGLWRRIRDVTRYSRPLIQALSSGRSAANLPGWAEARNNVSTAQKHFVARLVAAEQEIRSLATGDATELLRDWLEDADANGMFLCQRLEPYKIKGRLAPARTWTAVFDEFNS